MKLSSNIQFGDLIYFEKSKINLTLFFDYVIINMVNHFSYTCLVQQYLDEGKFFYFPPYPLLTNPKILI